KGGQLETQRFYGLVSQCRAAKERLLADPTLGEVRLSVPGRGGAVIGGALAAALARAEVEATVLDRFFPRVAADARPRPGGAPRTYYLGLGDGRALCLVPRGMEEGEKLEIAEPEFELLANRPVSFPLLTATDRSAERAGEIVAAGGLAVLPPIRTVLRFGRKLVETALPIHLEVRLTEIGTLEIWCRSRTTDHRWRLEFRLREPVGEAAPPA